MRERPILFSGPVVRAILDGRKTQARRVVKVRGLNFVGGSGDSRSDPANYGFQDHETGLWWLLDARADEEAHQIQSPYGVPGDRLYVKEAFAVGAMGTAIYRADLTLVSESTDGLQEWIGPRVLSRILTTRGDWRSPRFMPRRASRITLEITGVRVERLSDISQSDALAEGVVDEGLRWSLGGVGRAGCAMSAFTAGFHIINKLAADADPWVWVVAFKRVEAKAS